MPSYDMYGRPLGASTTNNEGAGLVAGTNYGAQGPRGASGAPGGDNSQIGADAASNGSNAFTAGANSGGNGANDGWTNLQTYLGLNPNAGQQMGNTVLGNVENKGEAAAVAQGAANKANGNTVAPQQPGVMLAQQSGDQLKTQQGQQQLLAQQYQGGSQSGYGPGQAGLDQLLFGAANPNRIAQDSGQFGTGGAAWNWNAPAGSPTTATGTNQTNYQIGGPMASGGNVGDPEGIGAWTAGPTNSGGHGATRYGTGQGGSYGAGGDNGQQDQQGKNKYTSTGW